MVIYLRVGGTPTSWTLFSGLSSLIIGLCACVPIYRNTPNISRALLSPSQADYVSCLSALIRGGLAGSFHLLVCPVVALPASAPHPLMLWQRILPKYYPGMHPSFDLNFRVWLCSLAEQIILHDLSENTPFFPPLFVLIPSCPAPRFSASREGGKLGSTSFNLIGWPVCSSLSQLKRGS